MSRAFENAYNETSYELTNLLGLVIALNEVTWDAPDVTNDSDFSLMFKALLVALREQAKRATELHDAEWEFARQADQANRTATT